MWLRKRTPQVRREHPHHDNCVAGARSSAKIFLVWLLLRYTQECLSRTTEVLYDLLSEYIHAHIAGKQAG